MTQYTHNKLAELLGYTVFQETHELPHGSKGEVTINAYYRNGLRHHLDFRKCWDDIISAYKALNLTHVPADKEEAVKDLEGLVKLKQIVD